LMAHVWRSEVACIHNGRRAKTHRHKGALVEVSD